VLEAHSVSVKWAVVKKLGGGARQFVCAAECFINIIKRNNKINFL
jgi:hypothetical protein